MKLDIITAIELTGSAAIGITAVASFLGRTSLVRATIAGALGLWFAWAVWLGQSSVFRPDNPFGLAVLGLSVALPIFILTLAVSQISELKEGLREGSLTTLVAFHIVRVLGVSFLLLSAQGRVAPTFAASAGWGDIVAGSLALPLMWLLAAGKLESNRLVWIWNGFGLLDLVAAVSLAVMSSPGPLHVIKESATSSVMTTLPWFLIPGFLVPLLAASHLAIFWRLSHSPVKAKPGNHLDVDLARVAS